MAARCVRTTRCVADNVILVVPDGYDGDGEGADVIVLGGPTRSASVRSGLAHVGDADIVVVHDAARPLATEQLFHAVVDAVRGGAAAAIPGLDVTDTVKQVRRGTTTSVVTTVPREDLVTVQTPQAFQRVALVGAHARVGDATDDAALLEHDSLCVVVPGERTNIKITDRRDLELLAAYGADGP